MMFISRLPLMRLSTKGVGNRGLVIGAALTLSLLPCNEAGRTGASSSPPRASHPEPTRSGSVTPAPIVACDPELVGAALSIDTSALVRDQREWKDAEGQWATVTRFSDESSVRVAMVVYYGDSRRTQFTYFLNTDRSYVALVEYAIYDPGNKFQVVSYVRQYFYICDGLRADYSWPDSARDAMAILSELRLM